MEARARSAVVGRAVSPAAEWVAVRVALADSGAARGGTGGCGGAGGDGGD